MQNFQDTFEIGKRSFISTFSVWMTVHYIVKYILCDIAKTKDKKFGSPYQFVRDDPILDGNCTIADST